GLVCCHVCHARRGAGFGASGAVMGRGCVVGGDGRENHFSDSGSCIRFCNRGGRAAYTAGMSDARAELLEILGRKSVMYGEFTLASGKTSDFYCDARLTTMDPRGAIALGECGWALVKAKAAELGVKPSAIGGLTMGADP